MNTRRPRTRSASTYPPRLAAATPHTPISGINQAPSPRLPIAQVMEEIVKARGLVYPISDKAVYIAGVKPALIIPEAHNITTPMLSVIILQLLAYYLALNKGINIDKPRNIKKFIN